MHSTAQSKADIKATNTVLGASYAIDNAKLFYTRVVLKQEQLADSQKRVAQKVDVNATYGAWVPFVQIGTIKDTEETGLAGFKHKLRQIGTTYNLSKRTTAYAIYGSNKVTSQADATWTGKETQTAIGVRHSF